MKKLIALFSLSVVLFSCQSYKGLWNTEANVKKVEEGMTYEQVLSIMGKDYSGTGSREDEDGHIYKILRYNSTGRFTYVFNFVDDILINHTLEEKSMNTLPEL